MDFTNRDKAGLYPFRNKVYHLPKAVFSCEGRSLKTGLSISVNSN